MEIRRFRGTGVALVTPFRADGSVDHVLFAQHVEAQIRNGVDFLVPCGTTGESATLAPEEQRAVVATAVQVSAGRAAVMAGAGTNDTRDAVNLALAAAEAGADAILSVSPYYNKPTSSGLYGHYRAIASAAKVPIFVYNVPGRTGSNVRPETLMRLAEIDNVIGVKEASGNLEQVMAILAARPADFLVLSGDDSLTLPILALGGDGVISVVANQVPDLMSTLVRKALAGELEEARRLHYKLLPLMQANFIETNPIPVKTSLEMMKRMPAHFRLPLSPISVEAAEKLRAVLDALDLL